MKIPDDIISMKDWKRFKSKIDKGNDCWIWAGTIGSNGYGVFQYGKGSESKLVYAHRLMFAVVHQQEPKGQRVQQSCKNPLCVCPDHLHIKGQIRETDMIVFIDMSKATKDYYSAGDNLFESPQCAFLNTTSNTFLVSDNGQHLFDREDIAHHPQKERLERLVPQGFWDSAD